MITLRNCLSEVFNIKIKISIVLILYDATRTIN